MKLDLLILAIAPVATIILWIYLKDKYDKEPIYTWYLSKYISNLCRRNTYKNKYIYRKN